MSRKLDLTLNQPKKKSDLTKESMLAFMKDKSKEERKWFVDLMNANKIKKIDRLHGNKEIDGYDMAPIRSAFGRKYFPYLYETKEKAQKPSFEDELDDLLK